MRKIIALAAAALLSACSGGSDDGAPLTDPNEPNDSPSQATPVALGTPIFGVISERLELDYFRIVVPAGGANVRFQTFDQGGVGCSGVDPWVDVYDAGGSWMDGQDDVDYPSNTCEDFTTLLGAGTYYVEVGGWFVFAYTFKASLVP